MPGQPLPMKPFERILRFWETQRGSRQAGDNEAGSACMDGWVPSTWPGAATSRHHLRWLRTSWVIWLVLLAPWGGLCERRSRAADPTTSRVTTIRGQEGASQPGVHGPGYDARTP